MSKLTDAVAALTAGVTAHGEAQAAALIRIQDDFTVIQAKLDAALADDAEGQEAVARIQESLALIEQSTNTLSSLDPDPENPSVPAPPEEPSVEGGAGGSVSSGG